MSNHKMCSAACCCHKDHMEVLQQGLVGELRHFSDGEQRENLVEGEDFACLAQFS